MKNNLRMIWSSFVSKICHSDGTTNVEGSTRRRLRSNPQKIIIKGSVCGSVGREVASHTSDPQFKSSHRQILFTIHCVEKTKMKKKRPGLAQFKKMMVDR